MFLPPSEKTKTTTAPPRPSVRQGLHYKHFEHVVATLLEAGLEPHFVELPTSSSSSSRWSNKSSTIVQDTIQSCAAAAAGPGSTSTPKQVRKQQQLHSMIQCILAMLPDDDDNMPTTATIVDFAGGTGHLSIPLALLLPHCTIIVVDLKAASLQLVHDKAAAIAESSRNSTTSTTDDNDATTTTAAFSYPRTSGSHQQEYDLTKRPCAGIPNLYTFHGSIESFPDNEPFDVGVALHACGEASDLVMRACSTTASAIVMAPCCVGKLNRTVLNPYIYHATGTNIPTVTYPQSRDFQRIIVEEQDWNALAKAADYSEHLRSPRNATRRVAKALLEQDRLLYYLQQQHDGGFAETALTRMEPWEASPKHDLLLGWKSSEWSPYKKSPSSPLDAANADFPLARNYLLQTTELETTNVEWTVDEMKYIQDVLQEAFVERSNEVYTFPTRMGKRQRKLIHHVAEQMGLRHWGHGQLDGDKTVIVAMKKEKEVQQPSKT